MKILIASFVVPEVIDALKAEHDVMVKFRPSTDELKELIVDREVVILRSGVYMIPEVMSLAPNLKLVIRAGSGLDNVDLDYLRDNNIHLARIPEPGARAVAEITFGFMISLAREFGVADPALREGRWIKTQVEGFLLRNKTLGIVGVGNIGKTVAQLANAWGMTVVGCVEHMSNEVVAAYQEQHIELVSLAELLQRSNFISLHVPLKESTRNLISTDELAMMKQGAFLINLARGGVVDEEALYESLLNGHLRGCALDVHEREGNGEISILAELNNVILTPHIGAQTVDTQIEIGQRILDIMQDMNMNENLNLYTVGRQVKQRVLQ